MYLKLTVLFHFWAHITLRKSQILSKTKIFPETTSLWISNNTSPRSQINHRILIQLIKKNISWAKNGLFKVNNRLVNRDQEVRGQVSTTFSEAPYLGLTVSEIFFCCSSIKTCVIPVLVSFFFYFHTPFLTLGPFLWVTSNQEKKPTRFPDVKFFAESFGKKI